MTPDEAIIKAAHHFSITKDGELSRDSTPYENKHKQSQMGVGFDKIKGRSHSFTVRFKRGENKITLLSHRMIFYLVYGYLPQSVDHIDRNPRNNKISNLRAATLSQNQMNRTSARGSSSRYLGVTWDASRGKWAAKIKGVGGQTNNLGRFKCEREAASHYNLAAMESHGEFANLNDVR